MDYSEWSILSVFDVDVGTFFFLFLTICLDAGNSVSDNLL